MISIDRRKFIRSSLLTAAALSVPGVAPAQGQSGRAAGAASSGRGPGIIDTNVHLFGWPFRRLKYGETAALGAKLKKHRVEQAWAGSYEGLFHKDIAAVNENLAEECRRHGDGMLVPIGSVNPMWPDWEEDVRRCQEDYRMPGIRLHPSYQNYTLEHPEFARLVKVASDRGLFIQIAVDMEDERVHHPVVLSPAVDVSPLPDVLKSVPNARVQLISPFRHVRGERLQKLIDESNVVFDISNLEGNGGVGRLIQGNHWFLSTQVPAERLLFGSHAPYFPFENAGLKLWESPLELSQLQLVMQGNARRFMRKA